ncbi:MAG: hypothetical protein JW734_04195 [Candidatus Omnitrophica bacterium]|nr:hypothetical protein [Candidatus Omnitrophota bacterium]
MVRIFMVGLPLFLLASFSGIAQTLSLEQLLDSAQAYDNKEIDVQAEVLDKLTQEKGYWLNLGDKGVSLGVWVDKEIEISNIARPGSYAINGDIIRIQGVFHSSCKEHLGQTDIHAYRISLVEEGSLRKERVLPHKKFFAIAWLVSFLVILGVYSAKELLEKSKRRSQ